MNRSSVVSLLLTVAAFGILVPWWKGLDYFDPLLLVASALVSLVFVTPMMTDNLSARSVGSQTIRVVTYVWVIAILVLAHGIATVNFMHWFGHLILPPGTILATSALLNLVAAIFLATLTAWITLRWNAGAAKRTVRIVFFVLLFTFLYLFRFASVQVRSRFDEQLTRDGLTRLLVTTSGILLVLTALLWRPVYGNRRPAP